MKQWLDNKLIEIEKGMSSSPKGTSSMSYYLGQRYIVIELLSYIDNNN